jgi:hypothetical protein
MDRTDPPIRTEQLLHATAERTVLATVDQDTGQAVVRKVFERGAPADAEREWALGRLAAGPGVVPHLGTGLEPRSGRPYLHTARLSGVDLANRVRRSGALPAAQALTLAAQAAATLARLHGLRGANAPNGLCHNDVKPHNLLATAEVVVLLDFEHAAAIGTPNWPAGTPSFAAPEATPEAPATAARDVYGLAATLRWLLDGGGPRRVPQDPRVDDLLARALGPATQRPTAAQFAAELEHLATELATDPDERRRDRLLRGDLAELRAAPPAQGAQPEFAHWLRRAERAAPRLHRLHAATHAAPHTPGALLALLQRAERLLGCTPRQATALADRHSLAAAAAQQITTAIERTAALAQKEEFAAAQELLLNCQELVRRVGRMPGGLQFEPPGDLRALGPLHRTTHACLEHQHQRLLVLEGELATASAAVRTAEQSFDLVGAERTVAAMAERYGGAAPSVVRHRDRLHRLQFYLQRLARADGSGDRLAQLGSDRDLQPLRALLARCTRALGDDPRPPGSSGPGLRSLLLALDSLAEEFPHLEAVVAPGRAALHHGLDQTTERALQLLDFADQQLRLAPVPVRPLQQTLARLDGWRNLEAFVDRPGRPRSALLDRIEALRLSLEQARATRDRLTQGAEQAIARGHWTTGLFDMERAVGGSDAGDGGEGAGGGEASGEVGGEAAADRRLRDRLAEARRKKQEVDAAARRNVELQSRYAALQDDPAATFAMRLQVLAERRDCLEFLALHLPAERGQLHGRDLRAVATQLALERADQAEQQFDATTDPELRLQVAEAALREIGASIPEAPGPSEPPARLVRSLDHWRTLAERCRHDLERLRQDREGRARGRRRLRWAVLAAGVALASSTALLLHSAAATPALAGPRQTAAEFTELVRLAAALPEPARSRAKAVVGALEPLARAQATALADYAAFAAALDGFGAAAGREEPTRRFAALALRQAEAALPTTADDPAAAELLTAAAERLRSAGVLAPAEPRRGTQ